MQIKLNNNLATSYQKQNHNVMLTKIKLGLSSHVQDIHGKLK